MANGFRKNLLVQVAQMINLEITKLRLKAFAKRIPFFRGLLWWLRSLRKSSILHGMTSREEQQYCRSYTHDTYTGIGEIVDLGCWLGSTTIPLAQGLRKNLNRYTRRERIHAYDLFLWEKWMDPYMPGCRKTYSPGESFLGEYKARTRKYSSLIRIYPGDLHQLGWIGKPIEFLLVDAMKSQELAESIVKCFYPSLIPEKSLLLHQDFKHFYTSWIHLIQYRLRDYFSFETDIPNSSSVVFRLKKRLEYDPSVVDFKSFTDREVDQAFDYSMALVGGNNSNIAAAKVMYFIHQDRTVEAKRVLDGFYHDGFAKESELAICEQRLAGTLVRAAIQSDSEQLV